MELRKHQVLAVNLIKESIKRGNRRIMLAAPCSFGKTITAAHILKSTAEKGNGGMMVCDRIKLIQQSLEAFDRHGLDLGVIQGIHERFNPSALIQIASVQTLSRRKDMPTAKVYIVDEAHIQSKYITDMMGTYNNCIFIGLSATPYSKGLGKYYQDIVVPITPRELLDQGYLCPVEYFVGHSVDLSNVNSRALPTGGSDFNPDDLSTAIESDPVLSGDIIKNWIEHGNDSQTIAFSPSVKQSKWLAEQFTAVGIPAEHIDGYMDDDQRQYLYDGHDNGEFKILCCSRLLNTGYDAPAVGCLIDCFPTKSLISYVQRVGRIMRTYEGKDHAVYLDHAGNVTRHGRAEDIVPESLDDGTKQYNERSLTKDKQPPKEKGCPDCYQVFVGIRCQCGYEVPIRERLEHDGTTLVNLSEMSAAQRRNHDQSEEDKRMFMSGLAFAGAMKGYNYGWAGHQYNDRYGEYRRFDNLIQLSEVPPDVKSFLQSQNIRRAKAKKSSGN